MNRSKTKLTYALLNFLINHRPFIGQTIAAVFIGTLIQLPTPYFTRILVDTVIPNRDLGLLLLLVISQLVLLVFSGLFGGAQKYFGAVIGASVTCEMVDIFISKILGLTFAQLDSYQSGDLMVRLTDLLAATRAMMGVAVTVSLAAVKISLFMGVLFLMSWKLATIALIVLPFDGVIYLYVNRLLFRQEQEVACERSSTRSLLYEIIVGSKTVQAWGAVDEFLARVKAMFYNYMNVELKAERTRVVGNVVSGGVRGLGSALLMWIGWRSVITGEMSLGALLAFMAYLGMVTGPIRELFGLSQQLQAMYVQTNRALDVLELPLLFSGAEGNNERASDSLEKIRIEQVSFNYGNLTPVLNNLSCQLSRGGITVITGESGCGKSTLLTVIARFNKPLSGQVECDGENIFCFTEQAWRSNVSFVMQDAVVLSGSISEYLSAGLGDVGRTVLKKALRRACLDEFVRGLKNETDTIIIERGANFSKGQLQRLQLARMYVENRPIVLLDEATSALDRITESKVLEQLQEHAKTRIVVMVSHSVSVAQAGSCLLEMHGGSIKNT